MIIGRVAQHQGLWVAIVMAVAIVLCLNVMVALADSHHEGKVYDANGWNQVAVGWWGTFDWAIDPNFPTTNDQGYNIRENMRDAMDEWAILRFGYQNYGYAEEVADFSSADYQYEECEGESLCYGSNVKQHHDDDNLCDDHWGWMGMDRSVMHSQGLILVGPLQTEKSLLEGPSPMRWAMH